MCVMFGQPDAFLHIVCNTDSYPVCLLRSLFNPPGPQSLYFHLNMTLILYAKDTRFCMRSFFGHHFYSVEC